MIEHPPMLTEKDESRSRLLTRDEVASLFGVSKRWLEVAATKQQGPPMVKITSKMVRYRARDVEAWIESHVDYGSEISLD